MTKANSSPKVFVIHGHNEPARLELCEILSMDLGLKPVVLIQQAAMGRTIIEQFEYHASECVLAVALITADDVAIAADQQTLRARQNVIFELGYFCALLGRERTCLIHQEGVELPSDLSGVLCYRFRTSVREVEPALRRHIEHLGLRNAESLGSTTVLVVDDDLNKDSQMIKQLSKAFENRATVELISDPERAVTLLSSGRHFIGCITDIVFRGFSSFAGVHVAETALRNKVEVIVVTGHKKEDIGIALTELKKIGIDEKRILTKPVTLAQYRTYLSTVLGWFLGATD